MDNPLLIPLAGGLAILLLLALLLRLRGKARRLAPEDETTEPPEHDEHDEHDADAEHDDTDVVPMLSYDDLGDHEAGYDHEDGYDREDADGHADGAAASLETLHVVESGDAEEYSGPEPVNVRYLRAQVRTLQEALERQEVAETSAVDRARFRRQVTAALRGLGERTREDESPERTLARVVAAIERLDAPDEVARPVLPTVKFDLSGAQMTLAGPQYVAAPAALGRGPVVTVPAPAPAQPPVAEVPATPQPQPILETEPASAHTVTTPLASALAAGAVTDDLSAPGLDADPFVGDAAFLPPPADPDLVLPVPPPAGAGSQRSRRWPRRHGA
jgi:hypothetical protein